MSFLTDAISQAENQINVNTKGQIASVQSGITGTIAGLKNNAASSVSGAVNNVVKSSINTITGSVGDLLTGNISGAISTLANAPSNIANSALSGLNGIAAGTLQSPGNFSAVSSNGNADPGNSLAGALARSDPLMSFCWYAQLPVISPGSTQTVVGNATAGVIASLAQTLVNGASSVLSSAMGGAVSTSQSAQLPWYYVEEANLPFRQYTSKAIFREGRDRNYPDKYSVNTLRLSLYMDSQNTAFKYIQAWNNAIITPFSAATSDTLAGGWGRPSDYKKPIYIYMLDVTKNVLAIVQYTECWPMTMEDFAMNSSTADRVLGHVTFSVGDVFINLMDVSSNVGTSVLANAGNNILTQAISSASSLFQSSVVNSAQKGIQALSSSIGSAATSWF